jgi:hypothetical protein
MYRVLTDLDSPRQRAHELIDLCRAVIVLEERALAFDRRAGFSVGCIRAVDVPGNRCDIGREMKRPAGPEHAPELGQRGSVLSDADVLEDRDADAGVEARVRVRQRGRVLNVELEPRVDGSPRVDLLGEEIHAKPLSSSL